MKGRSRAWQDLFVKRENDSLCLSGFKTPAMGFGVVAKKFNPFESALVGLHSVLYERLSATK